MIKLLFLEWVARVDRRHQPDIRHYILLEIYLFGSSLNRFFWRARPSKLLPWRLPSKIEHMHLSHNEQLRCRTRFYSLMQCHDYSWWQKCTKIDWVM